jgi:phosphoglycerate dehydrogenase-like enzyme
LYFGFEKIIQRKLKEKYCLFLNFLLFRKLTYDRFQMSLEGKVAFVTGFAGDVGTSVSRVLAIAGCTVIGTDRVKTELVKEKIEELAKMSV